MTFFAKFTIAIYLVTASTPALANSTSDLEMLASKVASLVKSKNKFRYRLLDNRKELQASLKAQLCRGFRYRHYRVGDWGYVIGSSGRSPVVGKHFKYRISGNQADLSTLASSTKGCLAFDVPSNVVALTVTHILSERPTEFHLITNLISGLDLYVSSETGIWKVSGGTMQLLPKDD